MVYISGAFVKARREFAGVLFAFKWAGLDFGRNGVYITVLDL